MGNDAGVTASTSRPADGLSDGSSASVDGSDTATRLGRLLLGRSEHGAVAESLTGGLLVARLAAGDSASKWLRGGITAYQAEVKQRVLGVPPGPVVTEETARAMADGVADLFRADLAVAVTGVGGPDPEEGKPPGTVWIAVRYRQRTSARIHHLHGDPADICRQTCDRAVAYALDQVSGRPSETSRTAPPAR